MKKVLHYASFFILAQNEAIVKHIILSIPFLEVVSDHYGRPIPKHAHGTENIDHYTSSAQILCSAVLKLYDRIVDDELLIRRVNVVADSVIYERDIPEEEPLQLDLFSDPYEQEKRFEESRKAEEKERRLQKAALIIQEKYGKNALLKGMNFVIFIHKPYAVICKNACELHANQCNSCK